MEQYRWDLPSPGLYYPRRGDDHDQPDAAAVPESAEDLLPDMITWPDNNPNDWYYLAVQEATNSHDFTRKISGYETWTALTRNRDWSVY